jgi:hypothetical protein
MIDDVVGHSAFGAVVVGVAILGIVVALVLAIRRRDAFSEERGGLWVFHGETDTSPHQTPGARFEDRHVIDLDVTGETAPGSAVTTARPRRLRSPHTDNRTRRSKQAARS